MDMAGENNGWTALMAAAINGHTEVLKTLLMHGASVRATLTNAREKTGWTPLLIALEHNHEQIIQELCKHTDEHKTACSSS